MTSKNWIEDSKIFNLYERMNRRGRGAETIENYLDDGGAPNVYEGDYGSLLSVVCRSGDIDSARLLLEAGADANGAFPGCDGFTPPLVFTVARSDSPEIVSLLVEAGADVNPCYDSPDPLLGGPIREGDIKTIRYLLAEGHDPFSGPGADRFRFPKKIDDQQKRDLESVFAEFGFSIGD